MSARITYYFLGTRHPVGSSLGVLPPSGHILNAITQESGRLHPRYESVSGYVLGTTLVTVRKRLPKLLRSGFRPGNRRTEVPATASIQWDAFRGMEIGSNRHNPKSTSSGSKALVSYRSYLGQEEKYMRSQLVFEAVHTLRNRYTLCQLASKATRKFHKPSTRIQDTTNDVLNLIADSERQDVILEPETASEAQRRAA